MKIKRIRPLFQGWMLLVPLAASALRSPASPCNACGEDGLIEKTFTSGNGCGFRAIMTGTDAEGEKSGQKIKVKLKPEQEYAFSFEDSETSDEEGPCGDAAVVLGCGVEYKLIGYVPRNGTEPLYDGGWSDDGGFQVYDNTYDGMGTNYLLNPSGFVFRLDSGESNESQGDNGDDHGNGAENGGSISASDPTAIPDPTEPTVVPASSSLTIPLGNIGIGTDGAAPYRSAGVLYWNGPLLGSLAQPTKLEYLSVSEIQALAGEFAVSFADASPVPEGPAEKHLVTPTRLFRITGYDFSDPEVPVAYNLASRTYIREYVRETRTEGLSTTLGRNPVSWYRIEPDTATGVKLMKSVRGWYSGKSVKAPTANELIIDDGLHRREVVITNPTSGSYSDSFYIKTEVVKRNGVTISRAENEYRNIEGEYRLTEETKYTDPASGTGPLVTSYGYYDSNAPGFPTGTTPGDPRWVSHPDGSWRFFRYSGGNREVFSPFASETALDTAETYQSSFPVFAAGGAGRYIKVVNGNRYVSSDSAGHPAPGEHVGGAPYEGMAYPVVNENNDAVLPDNVPLVSDSSGIRYMPSIDSSSGHRWLAGEPILTWGGDAPARFHEYAKDGTAVTKTVTTGYLSGDNAPGAKRVAAIRYFHEVPGQSEKTISIYGPQGLLSEESLYHTGQGYTSASIKQILYHPDGSYASTSINGVITHTITRPDPYTTVEADASGRVTTTVRNAWGEVTSVTEAGGGGVPAQITTYEINGLQTVTRLNGVQISSRVVDGLGRTVSQTDQTGAVTHFSYPDGGLSTEEVAPGGIVRRTTRYLDGETASVSGNGTVHEFHSHEYLPDGKVARTGSYGSSTGHTGRQSLTETFDWTDMTIVTQASPDGGILKTETQSVHGQGSTTTRTSISGGLTTLLSRRLDRGFLGAEPAAGFPGAVRYSGYDMNDDSQLDFGTGDRFSMSEWQYVEDGGYIFRKTRSHQFPDGIEAGKLTSETWDRLSFVPDGANGYVENHKTVEPSGRSVTHTTTVNRATATAVTVTDDSATAGIDSTTTAVNGRVTSVQRLGFTMAETYAYNSFGVLEKITDSRGAASRTINQNFQVEKTIDHLGRETSYTYYPPDVANAGRVHKVIHPGGAETETLYTPLGQVAEIRGGAEYRRVFGYNSYGERETLRTFGAVPATTRWVYQPATGMLLEKRYNDQPGSGYAYEHTPDGKVAKRTSARGVVTDYTYDPATRDLVAVDYSGDGDLTPDLLYVDHDSFGRPHTITETLGTTVNIQTLSYHNHSGAVSTTYAADHQWLPGISVSHIPDDALGRAGGFEIKVGAATVAEQMYGYQNDPLGRLHTVSSGTLVAGMEYLDGTGTLRKQTVSTAGGAIHERRLAIDMLGRTAGVENRVPQSGPGTAWTTIASVGHAYDTAGRRRNATRDDGTAWEYAYNTRSEVEGALKKTASGTTVPGLGFTYAYDGIGNRNSATTGSHGHFTEIAYTADALNQYTSITRDGDFWALVRADAAVTASATAGATVLGVTQEGNLHGARLHLDNSQGGKLVNSGFARDGVPVEGGVDLWIPAASASPEYDADGNLTDDGRWVYAWDGENRLVSMVPTAAALSGNAPDVELRFHYDHMSRRIGKTVTQSGNTTRQACAYDHWNPVAEWELAGGALTLKRTHLWGLDIASSGHGPNYQAAGGVGGLIAVTSHSALPTCHFPSYDANGNIIAWSDGAGTLLQRRDYDPFGNPVLVENLSSPETIAKLPSHGFSTKPQDPETGLYYYGYRYYDPVTGRWPSRDPIEEEGGVNLYGFVRNRAVNNVDKYGLQTLDFKEYAEKCCCTPRTIEKGEKQLRERYKNMMALYAAHGRNPGGEGGRKSCKNRAAGTMMALSPVPKCWQCKEQRGFTHRWTLFAHDHVWVVCQSIPIDGTPPKQIAFDSWSGYADGVSTLVLFARFPVPGVVQSPTDISINNCKRELPYTFPGNQLLQTQD